MKTPGDSLEGHPFRSVFQGKQRTIELQLQVWCVCGVEGRYVCLEWVCGVKERV